MVHRTARAGLRVTRAQRRRLLGLLAAGGDVWACVLELNAWRRRRQDVPLAAYPELCRELAAAGPGTFGELDSTGARSVLRRYSDAWFAAAARRRAGDHTARFPRRRRRLMPLRWYHGTFTLDGRRLKLPAARGRPPLWLRLDRDLIAAANIAARAGGGTTPATLMAEVTHRRAGTDLPGRIPERRDPRRRPHHGPAPGSPGRHRPAPPRPQRRPGSRSPHREDSVTVWGVAFLLEAALRVVIVYNASTGTALAISKVTPFLFVAIMSAWTVSYGAHHKKKGERMAATGEGSLAARPATVPPMPAPRPGDRQAGR